MKRIFLAIISVIAAAWCAAAVHLGITSPDGKGEDGGLCLMFWNLENFFDYIDSGSSSSDREFSYSGKRRWTKRRFTDKCNAVAKTVLWTGDYFSRLPDAIGLAEVENRFVLKYLIRETILHKLDYKIVHYDSPDPRGIDVALLYRESVFCKAASRPVHITDSCGNAIRTRDILYVSLVRKDNGDTLHLLVNHHPSKFSGAKASEGGRAAAMRTLAGICDSISACSSGSTVAMGDFNDTPDAAAFSHIGGRLVNKAEELHKQGEGTIRFSGKWDLIDMFLVSPSVSDSLVMRIVKPPFLLTRDSTWPGDKPFRTYSGPRYIGGVSDHLPIVLLGGNYFILE